VYVATCRRKKAYEVKGAAEAVAERLMQRSAFGEVLAVYRCPFAPLGEGGHFHVGHVRGTKPPPRMLRKKRTWSEPTVTDLGSAAGRPPD
jgi:hypothetical protein